MDEVFLRWLRDTVEAHMGEEQFGVEELSRELGTSRASLHRRVKQLTHKPIGHFLRAMRLNRARELLEHRAGTASEIAYRVGFSSPAYFNHCFHEHFGYPPGEVRRFTAGESNRVAGHDPAPVTGKSRRLVSFLAVALLAAATGSLAYFLFAGKLLNARVPKVGPDRSIVVMPFRNDSPEPDTDYFCKGIMEEINNQLQKISALQVKSRTAAEMYRNSGMDIRQIGRELGAGYMLEGSVRKAGDDVRIVVQLIDIRSGNHLWSEAYDGKYTAQIFDFQIEVAKQVAGSLNAVIRPDELKRILKSQITDINCRELAQRGWAYVARNQSLNEIRYLQLAEAVFRQLIETDPDCAQGYIGLAFIHNLKSEHDDFVKCVERAVELAPESDGAYNRRGTYHQLTVQPDKAISDFKKGIEINPYNVSNYFTLSQTYLVQKKDIRKGIMYAEQGLNVARNQGFVEPIYYSMVARGFFGIADYKRAEKYSRLALETQLGCIGVARICEVLNLQMRYKECELFLDSICAARSFTKDCNEQRFFLAYFQKDWQAAEKYYALWARDSATTLRLHRISINTCWAYVLSRKGMKEEAKALMESEIEHVKRSIGFNYGTPLYRLAGMYAFMNEKEVALDYLRQYLALDRAFSHYDRILIDPLFDKLKTEPEFMEILRRVQAEKAELAAEIARLERKGVL